jgi:hypothetical protein
MSTETKVKDTSQELRAKHLKAPARAADESSTALAEGNVNTAASYDPDDPEETALVPTCEQYERFQFLHAYFNEALKLGLSPAMLTFSRKAKAFGYFIPGRWRREEEGTSRVSEIALNPDCLAYEPREIAATIVHEMIHQWQYEYGLKKSRRGYHNSEWGTKMEVVGLMPSSTGRPGGEKTGQKMSDYVIEGGAFALAFASLPMGALLPFVSGSPLTKGAPPPKPKDPSKTRFECGAGCGARMWGKPSLRAVCKECDADFIAG